MDKKDEKIINCLKEHGRWSTQKIASHISLPITTVHYRLRKLESEGIIKGYTVVLDYKKIGLPIAAYVLIVSNYKGLEEKRMTQYELTKSLLRKRQVESAAMVTGGTDIVIKIRVRDVEELNTFVTVDLRTIPGIEKTQTMLILNEADEWHENGEAEHPKTKKATFL